MSVSQTYFHVWPQQVLWLLGSPEVGDFREEVAQGPISHCAASPDLQQSAPLLKRKEPSRTSRADLRSFILTQLNTQKYKMT